MLLTDLLNVDDAIERILAAVTTLPAERVPLTTALHRVLTHSIYSDINLPPFANSSMDGYAVRAADVSAANANTPVTLRVVADIPAGSAPTTVIQKGEAARIMTGAPMPEGADAVVPVEQTDSDWRDSEEATLPETVQIYQAVTAGDYVRPIGENVREGQQILDAGTIIRPQDIGMLAALGVGQVDVVRRPRVAIISTGDELVDVDMPLTPGKIRDSNSYTIAALAMQYDADAIRLPIAGDTLDEVRECFQQALESNPDVIISSAGVSVGTFDVVRTVLNELGEVNFWRVNLRPGKPLAFGNLQKRPFFGLPGNPVSVMVTFDLFVRPVLLKLAGKPATVPMVKAATAVAMDSDGRRSYIRVKLVKDGDRLIAQTTGTQSSGALMSMVMADGLLIIPEGMTHVPAGTELPVRLLRDVIAEN
ncbi:MAG: hypothetical protein CUN54_07425 [Phototrophicales bacterium]|nr:MAG: hypothetical protein CUN54_07425 [Phototrophicales bacterium]